MSPIKNNRRKQISKILDLYFSRVSDGSVPPELEASMRRWFGESADVSEKYVALKEVFEKWVLYRDTPSDMAIESWNEILRELDLPVYDRAVHSVRRSAKNVRLRRVLARAAAVVIPVLVATATCLWYPEPDMIVETVPAGVAMREVQLPDSTRVWLRSGGRLEYPARFGRERRVDISGEAFFDVAHNKARAFVVSAADVQVRVTGTQFNFSAQADEQVAVTLHEGSVNVKASDNDWTDMQQGEQFRYDATTGESETTTVDLSQLDWRNRELDFTDRILGDIFEELSQIYGIAFEVNTPLTQERCMVSFYPNEELALVLSVLKSIVNENEFEFEITPDKVIINNLSHK